MHTTTETRTAKKKYQPSVVTRLRNLSPRRPLSFTDSLRIAELQATRLLQLSGCTEGPVPESIITELPRLDVHPSYQLTGSGVSMWHRGKWRVRVNGLEPFARQRFSMAHELKHVIDAAHEDIIYQHLPEGSPQRHTHIEAICDAFAAALLMPAPWVKRQWYQGVQNTAALAWYFQVSYQAMHIRLQTLGLVERQARPHHGTKAAYRVGRTAVRSSQHSRHTRDDRRYHRSRGSSLTVPIHDRGHLRAPTTTEPSTTEGVAA